MELRLFCLLFVISVTSAITVTTDYGDVIGRTVTVNTGVKVDYYYAIPYAKPPVGQLRFRDPEPPEPWTTPIQATAPGPVCPQPLIFLELTNPAWTDVNEDCLSLNIFAPNDPSNRPYPVMLWIHGGGFQGGGTISFPGHVLASKGVVVVVINYRMGHLGFISTNDEAAPGNYGLKDQIMALKFVKDNIQNFGGDPGKVTIFGESAGASSVGLLSVIPAAKGLFHQVILESGTDLSNWAVNEIEQHQERDTKTVAETLGCPTETSQQMIDCLRTKDWKDIIAVPATNCGVGHFCAGFQPVIDGTFLPEHPHYLRREGQFEPLPTLIGSNTDDGALLMSFGSPSYDWDQAGLDEARYKQVARDLVTFYSPRLNGKDKEVYEALIAVYPPSDDITTNIISLKDIYTDTHYAVYDYALMESLRSRGNDVYHYIYGYRSSNNLLPEWMGATHQLEINYIFGLPQMKHAQNDPIMADLKLVELTNFTQEDLRFAELMQDLWTNFAKFGNPTPTPMTSLRNKPFSWHKAIKEGSQDYSYLYLGRDVENKVNYREEYMKFWTRCFRCIVPDIYEPESIRSQRPQYIRFGECYCPASVKIGSQRHAPIRVG